jgi:hypothetical protein
MRKVLLGGTAVGLVVVLFFAAWESMGDDPVRPAALAATAPTLVSPNGSYRIEVADTGILMTGPGVQVRVDGSQVRVQAPLVRLCGAGGQRVARVGDLVQTAGSASSQTGPIVQGSTTTFVC